jgi:hypothetical protein
MDLTTDRALARRFAGCNGNWVVTASGRRVDLDAPQIEAISIRDIAASLAKLCRFCGATHVFYSVAQHSVLVSDACASTGDPLTQLYALLHDAHEAYTGDVVSPLKKLMASQPHSHAGALSRISSSLDHANHTALRLPWPPPPHVRRVIDDADERVLATEWRDLIPGELPCPADAAPLRRAIRGWAWPAAEQKFMERYSTLRILAG